MGLSIKLKYGFSSLSRELGWTAEEAVKQGAFFVRDRAKMYAPVRGGKRSGNLKESIRAQKSRTFGYTVSSNAYNPKNKFNYAPTVEGIWMNKDIRTKQWKQKGIWSKKREYMTKALLDLEYNYDALIKNELIKMEKRVTFNKKTW